MRMNENVRQALKFMQEIAFLEGKLFWAKFWLTHPEIGAISCNSTMCVHYFESVSSDSMYQSPQERSDLRGRVRHTSELLANVDELPTSLWDYYSEDDGRISREQITDCSHCAPFGDNLEAYVLHLEKRLEKYGMLIQES